MITGMFTRKEIIENYPSVATELYRSYHGMTADSIDIEYVKELLNDLTIHETLEFLDEKGIHQDTKVIFENGKIRYELGMLYYNKEKNSIDFSHGVTITDSRYSITRYFIDKAFKFLETKLRGLHAVDIGRSCCVAQIT